MLLAAGEGRRLRPITNDVPKCMIPIAGKPVLENNILWLKQFGFFEFIINLYSLPKVVANYLGDGTRWGVHITYSIEERVLGTAGGVKRAEQYFDDTFLVWYGDNLSTCNISNLVTFHKKMKGIATIALFQREDVTGSGIVETIENNRIIRFLEKPRRDQVFSHWVNAGIYVLEPEILEFIPADGGSDFGHDIFPLLLEKNYPLFAYKMPDAERLWWIDTIEDLQRTQREFGGNQIQ
jgi:NDP-sugar pyrophosphorylase family protein